MVSRAKENTVTVRTVVVAPVANYIKLQRLRKERSATLTTRSCGGSVDLWEIMGRVSETTPGSWL